MKSSSFKSFEFTQGEITDVVDVEGISRLHSWQDEKLTIAEDGSTYFGFVYSGECLISSRQGEFTLAAGMFFSVPDGATITGGKGILIEKECCRGSFMLGGPVEPWGRLKYIDGCTDSLLIPPVKKGEPCLNALYFPQGVNQTMHTHPSVRIGIVSKGKGVCRFNNGEQVLEPGMIFVIPALGEHAFSTDDDELIVIAYHPDSDCGPEDEDHPMINRTIVNGKSARYIDEIKTK